MLHICACNGAVYVFKKAHYINFPLQNGVENYYEVKKVFLDVSQRTE